MPPTLFDEALIRRYDKAGPRYTSYPTAVQFHSGFTEGDYRHWAQRSNAKGGPLSLYVHIPFCNTLCYYCACNKVVTKRRERAAPYLARLKREIALQGALFDSSRTVDQLHFGGGTPTFISPQETVDLMEALRSHFRLREDDEGEYGIEIDPREVDDGRLALLRELGFNRLSFGVQDFDPKVQRAVNRIQPEAMTLKALERARALGFRSINLDLIYGLPFQSVESFSRTLDKVIDASPDRLSVFNYAHLPELFMPQRRIRPEDLPSPGEKLAILHAAIDKLTGAGYVYIGMDHFAKPEDELTRAQEEGKLYRNFQGYSTHAECDLVALGVTAIGKVGDTYSQNAKDLESYYGALDSGHLPIFRGIELDEDDKLRRAVIHALICHFRLDIPDIEARFGIDFRDYFKEALDALKVMAADGLLALEERAIRVLPPGRLLIRNICMAFDRYLKGEGKRFSKVI